MKFYNEECCRICMSNSYDYNNPLISPCKCNGSIKWTHLECINTWRSVNKNNFYKCDLCRYNYDLIDKSQSKILYYSQYLNYFYLMTRDILITIFLYQITALIVGYLSYKYKIGLFINVGLIISYKSKFFYLIYGNLIGAFLIGIISISMILIALFKDENPYKAISELLGDNINDNSASKKCCTFTIVIIGFISIILCFTYLIFYLMKKHSNKIWRKEQTKTLVIKPHESIPKKSILNL